MLGSPKKLRLLFNILAPKSPRKALWCKNYENPSDRKSHTCIGTFGVERIFSQMHDAICYFLGSANWFRVAKRSSESLEFDRNIVCIFWSKPINRLTGAFQVLMFDRFLHVVIFLLPLLQLCNYNWLKTCFTTQQE